ncbi:hypothetical protein GXP70_04290 [Paenibacillus lycopersici]|uniref:Uncharacterized protein n=1 Tax=Paenibacillus lycopersici TaxID=2704462 RepID=A0A6C0G3E3_9BACL|nr:hypothetical protein [Paenibacillus lycopersici]QHT59265.1 hypothetical protein GXP70_04290 [Paenibacillus lycopersici]
MRTMMLPPLINKYQVYTDNLTAKLRFFMEVSETLSGGGTEKVILNQHTDRILNFTDASDRLKLEITQRTIENGDEFFFLSMMNLTEKSQTLKFSLVLDLDNEGESSVFDLNEQYIKPSFSQRYGENKLTTPSKYIHTSSGSILVSKYVVYSDNILNYPDQKRSITRKLIEELDNIKVLRKSNAVHIETMVNLPAGLKSDLFLLISEEALFSSDQSRIEFFNDYKTSIANNDVRFNMWITPHGSYTKLPYSIEPFSPDAYGINLHHMSKKELLRYYQRTNDRFFYNLMYNAIVQLFGYRPVIDGLFITDYTSTWLKKDFLIQSPYIDTRLNETVTLAIEDCKHLFSFAELESFHLNYAKFLVAYSKKGKLLSVQEGAYFFPDYFSLEEQAKPTHSSLNHQLGILNYLLKKFQLTGTQEYERVANAMLKAIQLTSKRWIMENRNLFYKVYYKDNELHYGDTDYVYVTLLDLLLVQSSLQSIYKQKHPAIDELIISKMRFLENNNYGLQDEQALLPPNEDILSRKQAEKLALQLGYL